MQLATWLRYLLYDFRKNIDIATYERSIISNIMKLNKSNIIEYIVYIVVANAYRSRLNHDAEKEMTRRPNPRELSTSPQAQRACQTANPS